MYKYLRMLYYKINAYLTRLKSLILETLGAGIISIDYCSLCLLLQMKQEDSMSDDVFESPDDKTAAILNPPGRPTQARTPSPTGYKDYKPPAHLFKPEEPEVAHKVRIILIKKMYLGYKIFP